MTERQVRTIRIGPLVLGLRRRERPPQEWADFQAALDDFGNALLSQPEARWLQRQLVRLDGWLRRHGLGKEAKGD